MAELDLKIVVPDAIAQDVLRDFTDFHGYNAEVGMNRVQFMKFAIIRFLKESVKIYRARQAADQASNIDESEIT